MALNIPMPKLPGEALLEGVRTGGNLFQQIMHPILLREQERRLAEQFKEQLALSKVAAGRASASADRQAQLFPYQLEEARRKADPMYAFKQLIGLESQLGGGQNEDKYQSFMPDLASGFGKPQEPQQKPDYEALKQFLVNTFKPQAQQDVMLNENKHFSGLGLLPGQHEVNAPLSVNQPEQIPQLGVPYERAAPKNSLLSKEDFENIKRQMIYKSLGVTAPTSGNINAKSPEERALERAFKEKELEVRKKHYEVLERNASAENKIEIAQKLADIKGEQKRIEFENRAASQYKSKLSQEEGKIMGKMEEQAIESVKSAPDLDRLNEIVHSPIFQSMNKHPYLRKAELWKIRKDGTPEQKELLAEYDTYAKRVIANEAKGLNTRFTNKDLDFATSMKISDSDTVEAAAQKAEALLAMHELGQLRLDKAIEIANTAHVKPYEAIKLADHAIDADKIRREIKERYGHLATSKSPQSTASTSETQYVYLKDKQTGDRIKMTRSEANRIIKGAE